MTVQKLREFGLLFHFQTFSINLTFKEGVAYILILAHSPYEQISLCSCDLGVQLQGVTDDMPRQHARAGVQLAFGFQTENKTSHIYLRLSIKSRTQKRFSDQALV